MIQGFKFIWWTEKSARCLALFDEISLTNYVGLLWLVPFMLTLDMFYWTIPLAQLCVSQVILGYSCLHIFTSLRIAEYIASCLSSCSVDRYSRVALW